MGIIVTIGFILVIILLIYIIVAMNTVNTNMRIYGSILVQEIMKEYTEKARNGDLYAQGVLDDLKKIGPYRG